MKNKLAIAVCAILLMACDKGESSNNTTDETEETNYTLRDGRSTFSVNQVIDGETVTRRIQVVAPSTIDREKNYPVLFSFHGAGGSANQFLNNQTLNNLINSGEFIGIYPNGHNTFWNLGSENTNADDVDYVNKIVDELLRYSNLDYEKMYALGFSNGAGMVNLLGKSTEHFKAIAPMFSQQVVSIGNLIPTTPLSVFQLGGERDELIPLNGGNSPVGFFLSEEDSALDWVNHFNCNSDPMEESLTWGNTSIDTYRYLNCDGEHEIIRMVALNTGHGLEGAANPVAFTEVWNFFKRH